MWGLSRRTAHPEQKREVSESHGNLLSYERPHEPMQGYQYADRRALPGAGDHRSFRMSSPRGKDSTRLCVARAHIWRGIYPRRVPFLHNYQTYEERVAHDLQVPVEA